MSFLFVDDGSSDDTLDFIESGFIDNSRFSVLKLHYNKGKGEAIRKGVLHLIKQSHKYDWVGFLDADLATKLDQIDYFIRYADSSMVQPDAIFGSRIQRLGSEIHRSVKRHIFGRLFTTLTSLIFGIKCYDSQCGAKLFRPEILETVFFMPFVSKWIFDIEIILRLKNKVVIECPLLKWKEMKGSKLKVGKTAIIVLIDLYKIWKLEYSRI